MDDRLRTIPPRWMEWAVWASRLALPLGLAGFLATAWWSRPASPQRWAELGLLCLGLPLLVRALRRRWVGEGTVRCPACRKLTRFSPPSPAGPHKSEGHLRCDWCHQIIWGL